MLTERKSTLGKLKGKVVIQARPTGRKRVHHRSFCTEVAHGTTFSGAEVEAVLRLAAEIAKRHVENGDIVDFGDIGMLTPIVSEVNLLIRRKKPLTQTSTLLNLRCVCCLLVSILHLPM